MTISGIEEIDRSWILKHGMHHGTTYSRFYSIATGKYNPYKLHAVSAMEGTKVLGALIFEEYPDSSLAWGSFSKDRNRYLMNCRGRVGMFTLPENRGQGIGAAVSKKFCEEMILSTRSNAINLMAHQFNIGGFFEGLRCERNWFNTVSAVGRNHWERQIKSSFYSLPRPDSVSRDVAIETLISKGWFVDESKGISGDVKRSLKDTAGHEEWGILQRSEFVGTVPSKYSPGKDPRTKRLQRSESISPKFALGGNSLGR